MILRLMAAFMIAAGVSGCGSVRTLSSDKVVNVNELELKGTYCGNTIPRVYGGVVYNLCVMNGGSGERGGPGYRYMPTLVPYSVIDMGLSAVADTLTLPYSLYRQNRDGDIQLLRD